MQVLNKQLDALKKQASKVAAKLPKSSQPLRKLQTVGVQSRHLEKANGYIKSISGFEANWDSD
jgi:hypothetical protein